MPETVYILSTEQWLALTSAAAILRNTGQMISHTLPKAGAGAVRAAELALSAVQDVTPTVKA